MTKTKKQLSTSAVGLKYSNPYPPKPLVTKPLVKARVKGSYKQKLVLFKEDLGCGVVWEALAARSRSGIRHRTSPSLLASCRAIAHLSCSQRTGFATRKRQTADYHAWQHRRKKTAQTAESASPGRDSAGVCCVDLQLCDWCWQGQAVGNGRILHLTGLLTDPAVSKKKLRVRNRPVTMLTHTVLTHTVLSHCISRFALTLCSLPGSLSLHLTLCSLTVLCQCALPLCSLTLLSCLLWCCLSSPLCRLL